MSNDTPTRSRDPEDEDDEADDGGRPSAATQIVRLVLGEGAELFHATDGQAYMTIQIDGVAQTMPVKKTSTFIKRLYYEATDKAANSQAVTDAKGVLEGMALYSGDEIPVYTRLASANGNLYLDLGQEDWLIVEIGPPGWRVIPAAEAPVRFLHPRGMTALPLPLPGGDLADLRRLLHLKSEDDWRRLVGVLVACMNPDIEQPVIIFAGEPGASKTTTAERLKALIDPAIPALKSEPRNEDTLAIQARNGWLLGYDNLSRCPDWLSDAICRVSTGGGLSKRELWTDDDEIIFDIRRPVMLTSIVDVVTRSDLADRAFTISLVQIPEDQRRPKQEIDAAFEAMQPKLLGALLDICAGALQRLPETHLARSPRMAGIARWVTAAEEGLGWAPGTFVTVMQNSKEESFDAVIEASILAAVVIEAVEAGRTWDEVTAGALLSDLRVCAGEGISRRKDFPKNAGSLSGKLRTLSPALRSKGISIESGQTANTGSRKVWTIRKYCAKSDARDASDAEPMNTALSSVAPASISVAPEIESDAQNLNGDGGSVDSVDSVAVSAPLSSEGGGNGAAPRTEVRI
ncbi:MAG: hypothetical protein O7A71_11320 [Chloroflexi bacterium]|nr:hypothetical protein [Chloroflexota bacterium]